MTKILFIGVGLTHYFNKVLDKLGEDPRVVVYNAVSSSSLGHVGEGVYQEEVAKNFTIIKFPEKVIRSQRLFSNISTFIFAKEINVVVVSEEYLLLLLANPFILVQRLRGKLRIYLKSIPFRTKTFSEYISNKSIKSKLVGCLKYFVYNFVNGHLNYINEGYRIFGSYKVSKKKITVTGNSPDTDLLEKIRINHLNSGYTKKKHSIIHVGRLIPWKNVDMLIKAFNKLLSDYPDASLVIVGDGPELNNLLELTKSMNLSDRVTFTGAIHSYDVLGKFLMESDCYVLAGMGGLSINDAMAFGLPVIVSVCDGTEKDLVIDGVNGYFFEDGSELDLYLKLKKMFSVEGKSEEMGKKSLEIIRDKVNISNVINNYKLALIK